MYGVSVNKAFAQLRELKLLEDWNKKRMGSFFQTDANLFHGKC